MAAQTISPITDSLKNYRLKYNDLVVEVNGISSVSSITSDSGTLSIGSGQKNVSVGVRGGSNISTSVSGSNVSVALNTTLNITSLSATGNVQLNGSSNTINGANVTSANITNLTVGSGGSAYDFPTTAGSEGQALVLNASGDLVFGLGGTGVSAFKALSDTPSTYTTLGQRLLFLDGTEGGVASNVITDSTLTFDPVNNGLRTENLYVGNDVSSTPTSSFIYSNEYTSSPPSSNGIVNQVNLATGSGGSTTNFTLVNNTLSSAGSEDFRDLKGSAFVLGATGNTRSLYGIHNIMSINSGTSKTVDYVYGFDTFISVTGSQKIQQELVGNDISISNTSTSQFANSVPKIGSRVAISGPISATSDQIGYLYESTDTSSLNLRHYGFRANFDGTSGIGFYYSANNTVGPNNGMVVSIDNDSSSESRGIVLDVSSGNTANRSIDVFSNSAPSYFGSPVLYNNSSTNPSVSGSSVWTYVKDTKFVIAYDVDGTGAGTTVRYTVIDLTDGTISNSTTAP